MEELKDFSQLEGGSYDAESETETPKKRKIEKPADMLEVMGLSFKDKEKPSYDEFFKLAIQKTGVMSEALEKVVVPLPIFEKTFKEYFKLKGAEGKDVFVKWFDGSVGRGKIGFYSPPRKLPILLYINREEE